MNPEFFSSFATIDLRREREIYSTNGQTVSQLDWESIPDQQQQQPKSFDDH